MDNLIFIVGNESYYKTVNTPNSCYEIEDAGIIVFNQSLIKSINITESVCNIKLDVTLSHISEIRTDYISELGLLTSKIIYNRPRNYPLMCSGLYLFYDCTNEKMVFNYNNCKYKLRWYHNSIYLILYNDDNDTIDKQFGCYNLIRKFNTIS